MLVTKFYGVLMRCTLRPEEKGMMMVSLSDDPETYIGRSNTFDHF